MTAHFEFTRLTTGGLVQGVDSNGVQGSRFVSTITYDRVIRAAFVLQAQDDFDAAVENQFKSITDAAEQVSKALNMGRAPHPEAFVVVQEEVEAVEGQDPVIIDLQNNPDDGDDALLIKLVELGKFDDLMCIAFGPDTGTIVIKTA